jgi:hypothetical protein
VEFLAPGKEIATLLDTAASYFAGNQPTRIEAEVSWFELDQEQEPHHAMIRHDLEIYRDIAFVEDRPRDQTERLPEVRG